MASLGFLKHYSLPVGLSHWTITCSLSYSVQCVNGFLRRQRYATATSLQMAGRTYPGQKAICLWGGSSSGGRLGTLCEKRWALVFGPVPSCLVFQVVICARAKPDQPGWCCYCTEQCYMATWAMCLPYRDEKDTFPCLFTQALLAVRYSSSSGKIVSVVVYHQLPSAWVIR